jgi:uncharacterized repeat protein (TIGR03803 family)
VRDSAGNLYGTTEGGGVLSNKGHGGGVIFKLDPAGKETVLHKFIPTGGTAPSGLIQDSAGNLYGTTVDGGDFHHGVVFKLTLQ